jgi:hypothetical protein
MTGAVGWHERETTQWPSAQLSFARPLEHVDFAACCIDEFAPRDRHIALLPCRTASEDVKIKS